MPQEPSVIYRVNKESGDESIFWHELMLTLSQVNAVRETMGEDLVSYRMAVTQGLGLPDSFTGKIKNGKYVPTKDKLESLAAYLGVRPERWDTYVRRYASERLNDAAVVELFRLLASLKEPADQVVLQGVVKWARKSVAEAKQPVAA